MAVTEKTTNAVELLAQKIVELNTIIFPIGGQFLLDPNEFNAWGVLGPYDNVNSQDLGNVGAAPNRLAGGICFPFDVQMEQFYAWHQNNNAGILPWGWRIVSQEKTGGSNAVTTTDILREVTGTGATGIAPRDYQNTSNQLTDVDLTGSPIVPAGHVIGLGVESPTAVNTNRYVRVMSGFFKLRRV